MGQGVGTSEQLSVTKCTGKHDLRRGYTFAPMWHHPSSSAQIACLEVTVAIAMEQSLAFEILEEQRLKRLKLAAVAAEGVDQLKEPMSCSTCKQVCEDWSRLTTIVLWLSIDRPYQLPCCKV